MNERQVGRISDEPAGRIGELLPCLAATTRRPISEGAEKWLGVPIRVLDHGYVYLVDYMGNDEAIVQAARVSYGRGTKAVHQDRGLIRYLRRHSHTSPLEMVQLKFHMRLPIFVARQIVRHRTASVNEYSARYSILIDEFYEPAEHAIKAQSTANKQGRGADLPQAVKAEAVQIISDASAATYKAYERLLEIGVARELARLVLPVNVYTEWYWAIDLHNLFHFLRLRLDPHTQAETRAYAEAIAAIVQDGWRLAWEAFEDYTLEQVPLTRLEAEVLQHAGVRLSLDHIGLICKEAGLTNHREQQEFVDKLRRLGLLDEGAPASHGSPRE